MKLLIVTQKVDATDGNLGFFVGWLSAFAEQAEIIVIANEVGSHTLPSSVCVYSLGKEKGASRATRLFRYQRLLLKTLPSVDGVFFHMCPEYVIGAHLLPLLFGKKTALWYVHKHTGFRLRLAEKLVHTIFTASKESFRLRSNKVEIIGHGIDTRLFSGKHEKEAGLRLLSVGRISLVKDLRTIIAGFFKLQKRADKAEITFAGEPVTVSDRFYKAEILRAIQEHNLQKNARFLGKVLYTDLPALYEKHTVFVHASRTGSMDKTVLEALASGLPVFTSSEAFGESISGVRKFREGDGAHFAEILANAFLGGEIVYNREGREWVEERHGLNRLVAKILGFFTK